MIEDIMTKKVIKVKSTTSIKDTAAVFLKFDIGFLPVVQNKKVIGVITDRDLVTRAIKNTDNLDKPIKDYITKCIITCNKDNSIKEALDIMGSNHIKRLIVTDGKKMVGVISFSDFLNQKEKFTLVDTLEEIFKINRNSDYYPTEIDEFYL